MKKPLVEFSQLVTGLDMEKVAEAISEDSKPLSDWDFQDAKRLVWAAGEKWLPRDLEEFTLETLEQTTVTTRGIGRPFKYILDASGTIQGINKPFSQFSGSRYIIDWKTTKNKLDTTWRNRLIDSWQWQLYSRYREADIFIYRGLSRVDDPAEIIIKVPKSNLVEVSEFLVAIDNQIDSIRNFEVWPRNKPFACKAYGRECEFYDDCINYTMPRGRLPEDKNLSYSFIDKFMLCPEKARRLTILGEGEDTDATNFGKAVHRGCAELWRQGFQIYGQSYTYLG